MAWRGLTLTSPCRLNRDKGCLCIHVLGQIHRLAFEDIAYIVFDTDEISLTASVLSTLADHNILLITTDTAHKPNGSLLPLVGHHKQVETVHTQIALPNSLKSKLWQHLVHAKIHNQARVLNWLGHDNAEPLYAMAQRAYTDDVMQLEARAAQVYFRGLFTNFSRKQRARDLRNAMLNYGYAIVRAGLSRALVAQGFHPALGLNHRSKTNPFNLSDDLIEPLRPIVDAHIIAHLKARKHDTEDLTPTDKAELARVLLSSVIHGDEVTSLYVVLDRMTNTLHDMTTNRKTKDWLLPEPYFGGNAQTE